MQPPHRCCTSSAPLHPTFLAAGGVEQWHRQLELSQRLDNLHSLRAGLGKCTARGATRFWQSGAGVAWAHPDPPSVYQPRSLFICATRCQGMPSLLSTTAVPPRPTLLPRASRVVLRWPFD